MLFFDLDETLTHSILTDNDQTDTRPSFQVGPDLRRGRGRAGTYNIYIRPDIAAVKAAGPITVFTASRTAYAKAVVRKLVRATGLKVVDVIPNSMDGGSPLTEDAAVLIDNLPPKHPNTQIKLKRLPNGAALHVNSFVADDKQPRSEIRPGVAATGRDALRIGRVNVRSEGGLSMRGAVSKGLKLLKSGLVVAEHYDRPVGESLDLWRRPLVVFES